MANKLSPEAKAYWDKANLFVKNGTTDPKNPPWFELSLGDPALWIWADYFLRKRRWMPWGMRMLEQRKISIFMVPCERPEWFDVEYVPPANVAEWPRKEPEPSDEARLRVSQMVREFRGAA